MNIRSATPEDIKQLAYLKEPATEDHKNMYYVENEKRLKELEQDIVLYLVAENEDRIIGHLLVKLNGIPSEPGYPHLNDLYVHKMMRSMGIGSRLLCESEMQLKLRGCPVPVSLNSQIR